MQCDDCRLIVVPSERCSMVNTYHTDMNRGKKAQKYKYEHNIMYKS